MKNKILLLSVQTYQKRKEVPYLEMSRDNNQKRKKFPFKKVSRDTGELVSYVTKPLEHFTINCTVSFLIGQILCHCVTTAIHDLIAIRTVSK